jgi:hypothetical protein
MLMWRAEADVRMRPDVDSEIEVPAGVPKAQPLRYFMWKRPMARILWIACGMFWGAAGLSLLVRPLAPLYDNAAAGLLYSVFFPPLVCLYLLVGWLRQEIDSGRIVTEPIAPLANRSISGWLDPTSDPLDVRSGDVHRRHLGLD